MEPADGHREPRITFWRVAGWGMAAMLILTPLVAMQFTDEVRWDVRDFIVIAALLGGCGLAIEGAVRISRNRSYRIGSCVAMLAAVLLFWANGAVGVFADGDNPSSPMFLALLAFAILGSILANARPAGMALVMLVAGLVQASITLAALAAGWASPGRQGWYEAQLTIGFIFLWLLAGALFHRAAGVEDPSARS